MRLYRSIGLIFPQNEKLTSVSTREKAKLDHRAPGCLFAVKSRHLYTLYLISQLVKNPFKGISTVNEELGQKEEQSKLGLHVPTKQMAEPM